ncbi:NAD(P)/FAD-dependent oxidoreductase [Actinokineospora guangxiensis]|uniref:NAD(P)/FAD-dependent oxidoreductase n=1 Tax=Actinokineospora guangxiensis TaxID=1490288 RepID=A0ABW0EGX1_9PSEU
METMSVTGHRENVDVAVVGNGLIGLSTAAHLIRAGMSVSVAQGGETGRASLAAAGMLTPACEYDEWMPLAFLHLLQTGLDYYPEFLRSADRGNEEVGFRQCDFTLLDLHERDESLKERMGWMPGLGFDCVWLDAHEVIPLEPHLSPAAFRGGIRIRDQAVVDPIALWELLSAEVGFGARTIHSGGVVGIDERGERLVVATGDGGRIAADRVVLAAGSWSAQVAALIGLDLPVVPVKGQMVQLAGPPGMVNSVVFMPSGGCGSIVERRPGSYVVGTSEEYLAPTPDNTAGVIGAILSRLTAVSPAASDWVIERTWSGFRPMTSDELPIIGQTADARVVAATGHHRNGVLLAPLTGKLVLDLLRDAPPARGLDLHLYRYGRPLRPPTRFASKY